MSELRDAWTNTSLADAFEMDLGKMLSPEAISGRDLKPYLANRNVQWNRFELDDLGSMNFSASERRHFQLLPGDLLVCEGGEIGRAAIWDGQIAECYFQKALHRLRPKGYPLVDPRYLLHYMAYAAQKNLFQNLASQTSIAHLTQEKLALLSIRHPASLRLQRCIAEILDTIDRRIRSSVGLIEKIRDLRVASVRESLGMGSWRSVPLGSVLTRIDAGHSPELEDTPAGPGQWGVLKVSAIGDGIFRPDENKVAHDSSLFDKTICVHGDDLLITRANTPQLVGRSCIAKNAPQGLMLCDKTLRLKVDERVLPVRYVHIALGLAGTRQQIENAATGSSGSMKNISQQAIRQLTIPVGRPEDIKRVVDIDLLHETQISALRDEAEAGRLQSPFSCS